MLRVTACLSSRKFRYLILNLTALLSWKWLLLTIISYLFRKVVPNKKSSPQLNIFSSYITSELRWPEIPIRDSREEARQEWQHPDLQIDIRSH
jgi:hypothetical protein